MKNRDEILKKWEKTGEISPSELEEFSGQIDLLPFLKRDALNEPVTAAPFLDENEKSGLTDDIMGEITPERPRKPVFYFAAGAAASALLFAGLLLFFLFAQGSGVPAALEETVIVRFELAAPEAETVFLVGDFNDWDPAKHQMEKVDGVWQIEMTLEEERTYTYNFLIDGEEWISDPLAEARVDDPFGGEKSVINL
jgi:hypothetical protein